jgi:hypothetical protein
MKDKPIPAPTDELSVQQLRSRLSLSDLRPKAEILKREAKEKHRNARKRARKKKAQRGK